MKGIVLAGGSGTRLYPITKATSKQLVPLYDKPMIYYPISVLMLAGIKDILIITTKEDQDNFKRLLGDGSQFGIDLSYTIQPSPDGLAQAFILGEDFIGDDSVAMVLGDNIFHGNDFVKELEQARRNAEEGYATIFGYQVKDPERFGIMEFDENKNVIGVEEKPSNPKSDYCITGLYFYDNSVVEKAKKLKPSARGELEITDLNRVFLEEGKLKACLLGGGYTWFDTGTYDSLLDASHAIKTMQNVRGSVISCLEQIGFKNGWLTAEEVMKSALVMQKNSYGQYLIKTVEKAKKASEENNEINKNRVR
ncbi:MAG TPA: glucose-1-phosphate thymidylyltransferase RfbA [Tenericutes bacterium]|nr:glucose-1-phosphate thymidylyltransferase RfbA [Mycoplasmatota bacterium]